MEMSLQSALFAFFLVTSAAIFLLNRKVSTMQDPREPPVVPASLPYIGHVIGIMRNNFDYYVQLRYAPCYSRLISLLVSCSSSPQPKTLTSNMHHVDARLKDVHH